MTYEFKYCYYSLVASFFAFGAAAFFAFGAASASVAGASSATTAFLAAAFLVPPAAVIPSITI
ncbi:hypothetical protein D3C85_1779850 [compost metagenome]|jgi:hypothetical protein